MDNIGDPRVNIIEITSNDSISNASSHTRVVDPGILNASPLKVTQPLKTLFFFMT